MKSFIGIALIFPFNVKMMKTLSGMWYKKSNNIIQLSFQNVNKSLTIQSSFIYMIGLQCIFLYNLICFEISKCNWCMFLNIEGLLYAVRSARNHT